MTFQYAANIARFPHDLRPACSFPRALTIWCRGPRHALPSVGESNSGVVDLSLVVSHSVTPRLASCSVAMLRYAQHNPNNWKHALGTSAFGCFWPLVGTNCGSSPVRHTPC